MVNLIQVLLTFKVLSFSFRCNKLTRAISLLILTAVTLSLVPFTNIGINIFIRLASNGFDILVAIYDTNCADNCFTSWEV